MKDGTAIKKAQKRITEILWALEKTVGCAVIGIEVSRWNGTVHGAILDVQFNRGKTEPWEDYGEPDDATS